MKNSKQRRHLLLITKSMMAFFIFALFCILSGLPPSLHADEILDRIDFDMLPKTGFLRINSVVERVELNDKGEDIKSTRTVGKLNAITSLFDKRVLLEFAPMQLYIYPLDESQKPTLSKIYCAFVNDGAISKSMVLSRIK